MKNELRRVRPEKTVYMLAYTLELILYSVRGTFMAVNATIFGLPGRTVVYVGHMLASLIVIMLWSEHFTKLIRVSVAVMVAGFLPFIFAYDSSLRPLFAFVAMAGLGGAVSCARCGFAFAANNTERQMGMLLMTLGSAAVNLVDALRYNGFLVTKLLPAVLVAGLSFCLLRFREEDLEARQETDQSDAKGLYWALAFFIVYFGVDGYIYKLLDYDYTAGYAVFSIGMAVAALIFFASVAWLRFNVWHLWTLFFAFATAMALLKIFAPQVGSELPYYVFCGLSTLGWPLAIYMLACAQRHFASYRLLKQSTLIFVLISPFTTITDDLFKSYMPEHIPVITLVFVLLMLFLFVITMPFSYRHLFSAVWITDLSREDMRRIEEKVEDVDRFEKYGLTPRQKEVAVLLLAAKTRRQIAGELGLSESTVKTHTSDLYKKLGIGSRAELFRLFGVADGEARDEE